MAGLRKTGSPEKIGRPEERLAGQRKIGLSKRGRLEEEKQT